MLNVSELKLSAEDMEEAVQLWINRRFASPCPSVTKINAHRGAAPAFTIVLSPEPAEGETPNPTERGAE